MAIKLTNNLAKVLTYFFVNPSIKVHVRELARLTGLSHTWVSKIVKELADEGYLHIEDKLLKTVETTHSLKFQRAKRCYNLHSLFDSGFVDYIDESMRPSCIVLFGSYCYGEDTEESDIDIAVVTERKIGLSLSGFEQKLKRKISLHPIEIESTSKEFLTTLANGIILKGYLDLKWT